MSCTALSQVSTKDEEDRHVKLICVGDFNYNALNKNSKEWGDVVKTECLDHVWTKNPHMYSQTGVVSCILSDHCLVYAARKSVKIKRKVTFTEARSYRKFDQCAFANDVFCFGM